MYIYVLRLSIIVSTVYRPWKTLHSSRPGRRSIPLMLEFAWSCGTQVRIRMPATF
jgi:hypothetical protein